MLDLSMNKKLYQFKWVDGSVISLKPPKQRVYAELLNFQNLNESEAIVTMYSITNEVLNNNIQHKKLDASEIGIDMCIVLLQDYLEFYTAELNNIVFHQSL